MFSEKHPLLIGSIFKLRRWVEENLPIENSLIAYDLILLLSTHDYANSHITVKQLFSSLPHSATAVRSHYLRFVNDGWIEHYPAPKDKRIKYIKPTAKFIEIINAFTEVASVIFAAEESEKQTESLHC